MTIQKIQFIFLKMVNINYALEYLRFATTLCSHFAMHKLEDPNFNKTNRIQKDVIF